MDCREIIEKIDDEIIRRKKLVVDRLRKRLAEAKINDKEMVPYLEERIEVYCNLIKAYDA